MVLVCPNCDLENIAQRTVCKQCGVSLSAVARTPSRTGAWSGGSRWGCLSIVVIGLLVVLYVASLPSELDTLHQLAQMPRSSNADVAPIHTALLQHLPIGSSKAAIDQFLHQAGAEVGATASGAKRGGITCGPTLGTAAGPGINCLIEGSRPDVCLDLYAVTFILTPDTMTLKDITIGEHSGGCL